MPLVDRLNQGEYCRLDVSDADRPGRTAEWVLEAAEGKHFEAFVVAGLTLGSPVAASGPMVMSSQQELQEAFR
eukprot:scaffold2420_cov259-Pinguiococcus_pyrenoidosus.AAC.19